MKPLWTPAPARVEGSNLRAFARASGVPAVAGGGYEALHDWSVRDPEAFWRAVWSWAGVTGERGDRVVEPAGEMWRTRYFPDAKLNFAQNLLGSPRRLARDPVRPGGRRPARAQPP